MQTHQQHVSVDEQNQVSAAWAVPDAFQPGQTAAVLLAHGAGSDMHHPFMCFFHQALAAQGLLSIKFNFLYKEQGRKAPDRAPKLEHAFRAVLQAVRQHDSLRPGPLFIGGKSMGGRIASHLAAQGEAVAGLMLLGYPLHPPKKHDRQRRDHLSQIACPMLFLQGTRDPLCELTLLEDALQPLQAPAHVHVIDGADHSFKVPKRSGRTAEKVLEEMLQVMVEWLHRVASAYP
jgi:predicted alpha/beta-hydrolase family hydrolase